MSNTWSAALIVVFAISAIALGGGYLVLTTLSLTSTSESQKLLRRRPYFRRLSVWLRSLFSRSLPMAATMLKITVGFGQCVSTSSRLRSVRWPPIFSSMLEWLSDIFAFELMTLLPAECAADARFGFYVELIVTLIAPVAGVFALLALNTILMCGCTRRRHSMAQVLHNPRLWDLVIWLLLLLYPSLSRKPLSVFDCLPYEGGTELLRADPVIHCWDGEWTVFAATAGAASIIYCLGLPALACWAARRYGQSSDQIVRRPVALLVRSYRSECWYMESIDLLRKFLLTGPILITWPDSKTQLWLAIIVSVSAFGMHIRLAPYRMAVCGHVQTAYLLQLVLIYTSAGVLFFEEGQESDAELGVSVSTMDIILVGANCGAFVLMLVFFGLELRGASVRDPRWDVSGFQLWADRGKVKFVKVGYLRQLSRMHLTLPAWHELPPEAAYVGAPPSWAGLIAVEQFCQLDEHPDPDGVILQKVVDQLDAPSWDGGPPQATDDDCVLWAWASLISRPENRQQRVAARAAYREAHRLHTFFRIRVLVFPKSYVGEPVLQQGSVMAKLALRAYCQRLMNASDADVRVGVDPERFTNLQQTLDWCVFRDRAERKSALKMLKMAISTMQPVSHDQQGFKMIVHQAQVAFLKPGYVKLLARTHGPFPRRQDLRLDGLHVGVLPPGRIFTVSHGWASEMHPSPGGATLRRLALKLEELGAHDEADGVFLEYVSRNVP